VAAPVVAIVFDDEVLDEPVPVEAHDRGVAGVLTPGGGLRWLGEEAGPAR
jgi:5-formyltetrahydrofolate cyclo-ligase